MSKRRKTEKELRALIQERWGAPIGGITIVPGKDGYWNVLPLRTKPHAALESQTRFETLITALRAEFDLKAAREPSTAPRQRQGA